MKFFTRAALFCLGLLLVPALHAQSAAEAAKISASLSPAAQHILQVLSSLRELPDGQWLMHAGDVPHGESISLDDHDWTPIKPGLRGPNEATWFRQTVTIPQTLHGYDLSGARIWFQFHSYANGPMPEIVYFNGSRVALGDDLEPIVLVDHAKPGDKFTIAVKLLHTVDAKTINGASFKIDYADNRPSPEDLRQEFLAAALLVPVISKNHADVDALVSSINAVDLTALDAADQKKFDASLNAAHTQLSTLTPLLQTITLHLTGNSHIDAAWLWPWTETVDVVKRTFGTALQLMYEYPQYTYSQSAAAYNEWIADKYPDMNAEINRRIAEGRWEIVGGMWVEPDLNMPDGESLVRQLLVGKRWFKQHYGVDVRVGWNPDSFGYTWQLPQIYKKSGIDYFVTQKMAWNDTNQMPFKFFWWQSPDGSKVLSYFPHDYANDNLNPVRLARDFTIAAKQAPGLTRMMDLYGIGDHGGGPTRAILDQGQHWSAPSIPAKVMPQMPFGTATSYFRTLETQIAPNSPTWDYKSIAKGYTMPPAVDGKVSIPTWKSELYFEYHRGVMTTQANHKRNMRDAEVEVLNAEKYSSLAWLLSGRAYPADELTEDWKKVLFNQFHDLAAGSGIAQIYKDAQKDYDVVRWSTNEISAHAQTLLDDRIDTRGAAIAVVVYNPLAWERSGEVAVRAADLPTVFTVNGTTLAHSSLLAHRAINGEDHVILPVGRVPALGYKTLHIAPATADGGVGISEQNTVEDRGTHVVLHGGALTVSVDKVTGCITSLVQHPGQHELLAPNACANQLQFFKDTPKDYDAWNIDPGTLDVAPATITADAVEIVGTYPQQAVRIRSHYNASKFVQTLRLVDDQLDVENEIDWHESHILLKAAFPLAVSSDHATYEIPYGSIERPTTRNNSWEKAQFEVPAMRWADLTGTAGGQTFGLSVLNTSKYGYDAVGNVLRLSLLRSPKWPDPDADMGHHHFHYALYPHAGTWQQALTVRHGYEYNYPLSAVVTTAHTGTLPASHSFVSTDQTNVVLTAVKKAEDADALIVRGYEWAGTDAPITIHVPAGVTAATATNLQEAPEGQPLAVTHGADADTLQLPVHPFEIFTVRLSYQKK